MILKYSIPKGTPYIEFEDGNKLIFSTLTEDKKRGFNWLAFSGKIVSEFKTKGKGKKKTQSFTTVTPVNFITNMNFTKIPKEAKSGSLSTMTLNFLKSTFKKLTIDGYFPRANLVKLEEILNETFDDEDTDNMDDDPELTDENVAV